MSTPILATKLYIPGLRPNVVIRPRLIERQPPHMHLASLRARDHLTELRATDLHFTPSEAAGFLNQVMGLHISAVDIARLSTRTEGWIAGLHTP